MIGCPRLAGSGSGSLIGKDPLWSNTPNGESGCCLDVLVQMFIQSFLNSWCSRCLKYGGGGHSSQQQFMGNQSSGNPVDFSSGFKMLIVCRMDESTPWLPDASLLLWHTVRYSWSWTSWWVLPLSYNLAKMAIRETGAFMLHCCVNIQWRAPPGGTLQVLIGLQTSLLLPSCPDSSRLAT